MTGAVLEGDRKFARCGSAGGYLGLMPGAVSRPGPLFVFLHCFPLLLLVCNELENSSAWTYMWKLEGTVWRHFPPSTMCVLRVELRLSGTLTTD